MKKTFLVIACLVLSNSLASADPLSSYRWLFKALPEVKVENPDKVDLGKKLFFETALSKANDLSCNSCHNLETFGVDNRATSLGDKGQTGDRNSPTVFNAALHFAQFWDGRAKDVEEQALGPILNPVEMAMPNEEEVVKRLKENAEYTDAFKRAFPEESEPINYQNVGKAIGAFERTLLTPSRFDDFLNGKEAALSSEEKKGLETFVKIGCTSCHNGVGIGGALYQKIGLVKPYETTDLGRYKVTKSEADKYFFKVPSLRNVEKTAPYFHDGKVETLAEAVRLMGRHQLGRELDDVQTQEIITFLKSLTGGVRQ